MESSSRTSMIGMALEMPVKSMPGLAAFAWARVKAMAGSVTLPVTRDRVGRILSVTSLVSALIDGCMARMMPMGTVCGVLVTVSVLMPLAPPAGAALWLCVTLSEK